MSRPGIVLFATAVSLLAQETRLNYPITKKVDQLDVYHGVRVRDPYRWLEDTDSTETAQWIEEENKLTFGYLARIPGRERVKATLTKLFNYERYAMPFARGGRYFIFHNDGLQNQNVLFTMDSLGGPERVLLDPNTLRKDGTAALTGWSVSRGGKLLAYAISQAGSDWQEWRVRDIGTGKDLPDLIQWTKFTDLEWTPDDRAFYYSRFPEPPPGQLLKAANENSKIYLHRLGEAQSADTLVYERPDHKKWDFNGTLTEDGRYLVINVFDQDYGKNMLFYRDLRENRTVELIDKLTALYGFLGNQGSRFLFQTTDGAPRGRIIEIDVARPARENWREIVPERAEALDTARFLDGKLIAAYLKDAHAQAQLYGLDGKLEQEIALPGLGTAMWSPARQSDRELFYSFTGFTVPGSVYHFDVRARKSTLFRASKVNFDPSRYETRQVFYSSKDGTRVPMFLTYRKGIKQDGSNPALLTGYGGFNVAVTPTYSPINMTWLELGGMLAVANLRGGSEYGEQWHLAGTKLHKQNVFDDFIAAAEWLIANRYTSTPKLAIRGASNGGLLVGACLNQRPDLFGAAAPAVGVMDMLRFHKFTVGEGWTGDYGSPDNPEEFRAIYAYSPLQNIRKGTKYPPVIITTSDHDDRVVPGHSLKYAATLQEAQEGTAPILIRVETRAGHGGGKPTAKVIEESSDVLAFLAHALKMPL